MLMIVPSKNARSRLAFLTATRPSFKFCDSFGEVRELLLHLGKLSIFGAMQGFCRMDSLGSVLVLEVLKSEFLHKQVRMIMLGFCHAFLLKLVDPRPSSDSHSTIECRVGGDTLNVK